MQQYEVDIDSWERTDLVLQLGSQAEFREGAVQLLKSFRVQVHGHVEVTERVVFLPHRRAVLIGENDFRPRFQHRAEA